MLAAACTSPPGSTPASSSTAPSDDSGSLSPEAAALPHLAVTIAGRDLNLAGYDPDWPRERAEDQRTILRLAPYLQLARGQTYPVTLKYQGPEPVRSWLPPDFGYAGGSDPAGTQTGRVADVPTSAFVRADALPDFEAGLFGVSSEADAGPRPIVYPVWIQLSDVLAPDAFSGFALGISNEDGQTSATAAFIDHVQQDLKRGGGPEAMVYPTRDALMADYEGGRLDAFVSIPKGWSDQPTTTNGFESGSRDPVTGNSATDTGDSYRLGSIIIRALGPAGLIYDRGY